MKRKLSAILLVFAAAISGMFFTTVSASAPATFTTYCYICGQSQTYSFLGWYCTQNSASHYGWYSCDVCGREAASSDTREAHSGGTATCSHKAVCTVCISRNGGVQQEYGELDSNNHEYGTLIPAQPEVHTATELKPAVAAHYHCPCGKYFTVAKVETTLEALTGETPKHSGMDDGDCTTAVVCKCGYVITPAKSAHDWSNCDGKCATPGCTVTCDHSKHESVNGRWEHCTGLEGYNFAHAFVVQCSNCGKGFLTKLGNHDIVPATCEKSEYCSVCGLNNPEFCYPALGHDTESQNWVTLTQATCYQDKVEIRYCSRYGTGGCEDYETRTVTGTATGIHDWSKKDGKCATPGCTATCDSTADENKDHACDICGKPVSTCANNLTPVNGQAASCKVDGWKDYYTCSICGKNYSDASAQSEITDLDEWKAGKGKIVAAHVGKTHIEYEPIYDNKTESYNLDDHSVITVCDTCGDPISMVLGAHKWVKGVCEDCELVCPHSGGKATCKDKAVCEICGEEYGELDKTNHVGKTTDRFTWIMDSGTADLTQHVHGVLCDTCGNPVSAEKENHIWVDGKCKLCGLTCDHKENTNHATCGHAANCSVCGMEVEKALLHWFSQWKPCSDGYHAAYCLRKGCDGTAGLPCEWFELTFETSDEEEMTVSICPVCGAVRHEDIVFEVIKSATVKANEKWLPRGELIVRGMENPYGDCLYLFTVGYEYSGWLEDFLGAVTVTIPMEKLEGDFRLFYVDMDEETQEQILTEVEYTFEDDELIFETEKQGIFLILPVSE